MEKNYKILKYACYSSNISMSIIGNLSPILFLTFRSLYGISYTLLGLLVTINFSTQLIIDLIFSFFSHKFNIQKTVRIMPILTVIGLTAYALSPVLFKDSVYIGLILGTIIFSASAGLGEVLISPVVAAIPAKNPEREMSKLHSIYAWGVVAVIIFSTLFLLLFGNDSWQWLAAFFILFPIISAVLFFSCKIPKMETPQKISGVLNLFKNKSLWLCVTAIFLGGASECTMAQWGSGYLEGAFNIPKVWGDVFGVALFSVMLGLGRTIYGKIGKNISRVLFFGAIGASLCYFIAAVSPIQILGLFACALTGLCVSMMWPGSLIIGSEYFSSSGVFIYALMAAGGDMGASLGPQLIGIITDFAINNPKLSTLAENLSLSPEQLGLKIGMLIGMLFPVFAICVYFYIDRRRKNKYN